MSSTKRAMTPADLTITPRNRRFGRDEAQRRWWLRGDPIATAFFNAFSATFPKGEAFFVDSVRAFREGAEPKLDREIAAFVGQEVMHSREHVAFNRRVEEAGYDMTLLDRDVDARLDYVRSKPPIVALAATMALEHFTAIFARALIADARHLAGAGTSQSALWLWHALEEIEHKGVAYDTWLHATREWPRFKRWAVKAKVMLLVTRNFVVDRTRGVIELLRQDGLRGPTVWARMFWFAFVAPGIFRRMLGPWASFFLPGFHPGLMPPLQRAAVPRPGRACS